MKLFEIPDGIRAEEYEEDGETNFGDAGKCGGCNWEVHAVWMLGASLEDAIDAFRENHRGLCGDCMCEMISQTGRDVQGDGEWR